MKNAVQTRQRMLALTLPLTAALYIGAGGLRSQGYGPNHYDNGDRLQGAADRGEALKSALHIGLA